MKLSDVIQNIFSKSEIDKISKEWLDSKVNLSVVENVEEYISQCDNESVNFKTAGPERQQDWEWGWSGNGVTNESRQFPNIPYYFKNNTHVRIGNKVYLDETKYTEIRLLRMLQDIAFSYVEQPESLSLIEYGAGTGHNLVYLKKKNFKTLYAADWAESAVKKLVSDNVVDELNSFRVDYFSPSSYMSPNEPFVAFTNASLEQAGDGYKDFMQFLINNEKCKMGVHIEPISDLVKPDTALNVQSKRYAEKRKYLHGFYEYILKENVKIILARDYGLGSKYISGYQVLIWTK